MAALHAYRRKQTFTVKATKAIMDREYRCVLTDESGTYHSLSTRVKAYAGMNAITHAWVSGTRVSLAWRECGVNYTLLMAKGNGAFQEIPMTFSQKRNCYFDFSGETEDLTLEKATDYRFKLRATTGKNTVESATVTVTTGNYATGAMPADVEGNGDGVVTLNELHRYIQRWGDRLPYARNKEIYITQQVQAYPENSGYPLFTR